eukprot:m.135241 g.135241  ORF g.135241 m.135241 type:complete len:163 (+) comp16940_c0_seq4:635-1123(+)
MAVPSPSVPRSMSASTGPRDSHIRIKCIYGDEKRILFVSRPVIFDTLYQQISELYGQRLTIKFEDEETDLVAIKSQAELDHAIDLFDRSEANYSLRLHLTEFSYGVSPPGSATNVTMGCTGLLRAVLVFFFFGRSRLPSCGGGGGKEVVEDGVVLCLHQTLC